MSEPNRAVKIDHPLLTIQSWEQGEALVVALKGEFDLASARVVGEELARAEKSYGVVLLDLADVTFMDSSGLHAVLEADQRIRASGGRLRLISGSPQVQRLLALTGAASQLETDSGVASDRNGKPGRLSPTRNRPPGARRL